MGEPGRSLMVRHLSEYVRGDDLRMEAEKFGEVRDVYIPKDFHTKRPKGLAFIEFQDAIGCEDAIEGLEGLELEGQPISVNMAKEGRKKPDDFRGGRGYGRDDRRGGGGRYDDRRGGGGYDDRRGGGGYDDRRGGNGDRRGGGYENDRDGPRGGSRYEDRGGDRRGGYDDRRGGGGYNDRGGGRGGGGYDDRRGGGYDDRGGRGADDRRGGGGYDDRGGRGGGAYDSRRGGRGDDLEDVREGGAGGFRGARGGNDRSPEAGRGSPIEKRRSRSPVEVAERQERDRVDKHEQSPQRDRSPAPRDDRGDSLDPPADRPAGDFDGDSE